MINHWRRIDRNYWKLKNIKYCKKYIYIYLVNVVNKNSILRITLLFLKLYFYYICICFFSTSTHAVEYVKNLSVFLSNTDTHTHTLIQYIHTNTNSKLANLWGAEPSQRWDAEDQGNGKTGRMEEIIISIPFSPSFPSGNATLSFTAFILHVHIT